MKRWTILLIPHDTEQPRSFAVSSRALRWWGAGAGAVCMVAAIGIVSAAGWIARPSDEELAFRRSAERMAIADSLALAEVDSLRATMIALRGALDTIGHADARLSAAAGVPPADSATLRAHAALRGTRATADSLLRGASAVARRLRTMADSADRSGGRNEAAVAAKAPR